MNNKNVKGNKTSNYGIMQNNETCDTNTNTPNMLINIKKYLTNGNYKVAFKSKKDTGSISMIFKYNLVREITGEENETYYTFDFNAYEQPENNNYTLRKFENKEE